MKKVVLGLSAVAMLFACGGETPKAEAPKEEKEINVDQDVKVTEYAVSVGESTVNWSGKKLAYGHNGTVNVQSGKLTVAGGELVGAEVVIDMKSINDLDLESPKKDTLEAHLMGKNFFKADSFPTAVIKVTDVAADSLTANLTVKGVTKSIKFPATVNVTDAAVEAKANIVIDRTDFGVVYGSGSFMDIPLDKAIHDEMQFEVSLKATK